MAKLLAILLSLSLVASTLSGCGILYLQRYFSDLANQPVQEQVETETETEADTGPEKLKWYERITINARPLKDIADDLFLRVISEDFTTYQQLIANPETFDFGEGFVAPKPTLGDISFQASSDEYEYYRTLLRELRVYEFDFETLSKTDQRLFTYLSFFLESALATEPFFYLSDPYAPSIGIQIQVPLSLLTFQFRTRADIDNYLALVADIPRLFDQANAIIVERTQRGIYPNRASVESTIEEAETYAVKTSRNLFITSFEDSLNSDAGPFADLTDEERNTLRDDNRKIVEDSVVPAYENAIAILKKLATETTYETTLAQQTGAQEYYTAMLRAYGFDETPEQAIKTLDENLLFLIDLIFDGTGTLDIDEWDRIASKNLPKDATEIIELFNKHVSDHFPDIGQRPFKVESASDDEVIAKFSAFYLLAPVDDLTMNRIKYYPQNIPGKYSLGSTLAHESFPGHLYQYNYFGLTKPHPIEMLLGTTAYAEGYAVYGEFYGLLAMGFSEEEARVVSAYEIFLRALQARLDIGINYQGWDLEKTQVYLSEWGMGSVAEEIFNETASAPLIMVPYGLGPLEFTTLLSEAKAAFGDSFDIVEFHTVILKDGALPIEVLRKNVYAWIG